MQPKQKNRKGVMLSTGSFVAQEKGNKNRDFSNGPFQGVRNAGERVKEITSRRRWDLLCKTGQTQPEDGRRR